MGAGVGTVVALHTDAGLANVEAFEARRVERIGKRRGKRRARASKHQFLHRFSFQSFADDSKSRARSRPGSSADIVIVA